MALGAGGGCLTWLGQELLDGWQGVPHHHRPDRGRFDALRRLATDSAERPRLHCLAAVGAGAGRKVSGRPMSATIAATHPDDFSTSPR